MTTIHQLKTAPKYFNEVIAGLKKAELRKNDRHFMVGDILILREWEHGRFTGREWMGGVTSTLPVGEVIKGVDGWVVLSIHELSPLTASLYVLTGELK